jgi:hypothetical protein
MGTQTLQPIAIAHEDATHGKVRQCGHDLNQVVTIRREERAVPDEASHETDAQFRRVWSVSCWIVEFLLKTVGDPGAGDASPSEELPVIKPTYDDVRSEPQPGFFDQARDGYASWAPKVSGSCELGDGVPGVYHHGSGTEDLEW